MTGLVVRKVRSGGRLKPKLVPVQLEGVVKLERVQVICPACGQQVEAVATDGRVKGYCGVAKQYVDFQRKKKWQDPEYRATQSAASKRLWQDPEYRAKQSAASKRLWQDPEYRATQSAASKKRWQDPEYRAKQSATRKKRWQDPEYRAKMMTARIGRHKGR